MFSVHFPKENVQRTFSKGKCSAKQNVTNAFDAYILLVQKCIFAKQNVTNAFDAKMHFGVHFPKENVQRTFSKGKCSAVQKCCVFCFAKNKDAYILFCLTFSFGKCSAKQNVTNAFDAKMHLMPKCIFASHFTLENVQHHIFQRKM